MKWYKHLVDSGDDPDIDDAFTLFGPDGYYIFFRTLEIISREFDIHNPGECLFMFRYFRGRFRGPYRESKLISILNHYQDRHRIYYRIFDDNGHRQIWLKCPKLKELCDEFTQKKLKQESGLTPDVNRDSIGPIEEEVELDIKENIIKENFGEFQNVLLTKDERGKLIKKFGEDGAKQRIENCSTYLASKGKKYKSHYATILNWERNHEKQNGKSW